MATNERPKTGTIGWLDLTVDDADGVRDFYRQVVGWGSEGCDMGGYEDYTMTLPSDGTPVGGVCHARGTNAGLPACWLAYVNVDDLDHSLERCQAGGGTVVAGPKTMESHGRYAVIRDPAGAAIALFEPA